MIPRESVEEFIKIYKDYYDKEIKNDDAYELAQNLLNVYRIVYKTSLNGGFALNKEDNKVDNKVIEAPVAPQMEAVE